MSVKKLGKATFEIEERYWFVESRPKEGNFVANPRLFDKHPEMKALNAIRRKAGKNTPPVTRPNKRKAYFEVRDNYLAQELEATKNVYEEIKAESMTSPILLKREKDYDHGSRAWMHCLYKGNIYSFDKQGYLAEEMLEQIEELEVRKNL